MGAGPESRRAGTGRRSDAMCHEHVDLRYLKEAEKRTKGTVRDTTPAPAPAAEPAGGLVAVLRGLVEKVRSAKTTVPAE
jgi:hypothetical protein